jgi:tetratricopeptide (TPR) repeat protein
MERYDDAMSDYAMALQIEPEFVLSITNYGWAFYYSGDRRRAREYWERALRLDPEYQDALDGMAELESRKK